LISFWAAFAKKRKGNLFVEVRDLRGEVRSIERTNWRSEQGHREVRLSIRGRTRKGRAEEEMTRYRALMAVVGNWGREGYAKAMEWEREDIVRAMGTVTREEFGGGASAQGSDVTMSVGCEAREAPGPDAAGTPRDPPRGKADDGAGDPGMDGAS